MGSLAAGPLASGFTAGSLENADCDWIEVPPELCADKRFVVRVAGDSMAPFLHRGDHCVFEYHRTPRQDGQVVVVADFEHDTGTGTGEVAIKRFRQDPKDWLFTSDNPAHPAVRIPRQETDRPILGTFVQKLGEQSPR